jgi:hypothetical protein
VVRVLQLNFTGKVELCSRRISSLILGHLISPIVIRPFLHHVILAVCEELDGFHGLIPMARSPSAILMVLHECSADECLANIGNALVAKIVGET